ncbi:MAG: KAP family P-loop NTPase fold protein [Carnobacterium maltaromaticum]
MDNFKENLLVKWRNYYDMFSKKYSFINSCILGTLIASMLVFLDYNNYPSNFLTDININTQRVFIFLGILLLLLLFCKIRIFKMLIHPLLNKLDQLVLILLVSNVLYVLSSLTRYNNLTPKVSYVNYLIAFFIFLFIVRLYNLGKKGNEKISTIVDLKDILNGDINFNSSFLLRESAVSYDLLNRDRLIRELADLFKTYVSEERFVIGIEGKWGSGKTTLLKNLSTHISEYEEMIVIDDFEPWISENKESLLYNLLKKILKESKLEIPDKEIDRLISSIMKNILGETYFKPIINLIAHKSDEQIDLILNDINYMINRNNKKIVFIIDNLDRLAPENVFLILNVVNNILNFNNLIVILSYDKDELNKGLESINVSPAYLNKLVQKRIILPLVKSEDLHNIYYNSLVSLFNGKEISFDQSDLVSFVKVLSDKQVGLREFKNYVNSVVIPFVNNPRKISSTDYLIMEYIRINDFNLFNLVYFNQDFFVSVDQGRSSSFSFMNSNKFDQEVNNFFDELNFEQDVTKELLTLIFPVVKTYFGTKQNYRNVISSRRKDLQYQNIQRNKKICSAKFFDLYFTHDNNFDSQMIDFTENFMKEINYDNLEIEVLNKLVDSIIELEPENQTEFFISVSLYIDQLLPDVREKLAEVFIKNYLKFGNFSAFFALSTKDRIAVIISDLLSKIEYSSSIRILQSFVTIPKYLSLISSLIYWLERNYESDNSKLVEYLTLKNEEMIIVILSGKYNLFDREWYSKGNVFKILWNLREKEQNEKFKEYIENNINNENVYRVLNDFVSNSIGTEGFLYQMMDNFQEYIDVSILEKLIRETHPKNEKQVFLKRVFDNYLLGEKDVQGELKIRREDSIDLTTIDI